MYTDDMKVDVQRVMLEKLKVTVRSEMDSMDLKSPVEIDHIIDFMGQKIAYQFQTYIYGQKLEKIKYPANWKEAFKENWFPKWLLKKFPVKYSYIQPWALYPQLYLPTEQYQPVFHVLKEPWRVED